MFRAQFCPSAKLAAPLALLALASTLMAAKTVYTTNSTGSTQNLNQFASKSDAYIRDETPGTYYFEVTGPNGPLLSSDDASCRLFTVDGFGQVTSPAGCAHTTGGGVALQLIPFNDSPNNGGVYKVHVIPQSCVTGINGAVLTYTNSCDKSDNFKVGACPLGGCTPVQSTISGVKYYDGNQNGLKDIGETLLQNWQINVTLVPGGLVSSVTNASGVWSVTADAGTLYTACEVIPPATSWVQTGPVVGAPGTSGQCWVGTFDTADASGLDFGNAIKIDGKKYSDSGPSSLLPNGQFDAGEPGIAGFKINSAFCNPVATPVCTYTPATPVFTAVGGAWSLFSPLPPNGVNTFQSCEVVPAGGFKQTGPLSGANNSGTASALPSKCWLGTLSATAGANSKIDFGNVCQGDAGALSKGWWSKNGNASITDGALAFLAGLNLKDGAGADFDPVAGAAGRAAVATYLANATATNMAYMLSAQFATMELDVFISGLSLTSIVYAPGTLSANGSGFATLGALFTEANAELALHPISGAFKPYQEAIKNAFDPANKNIVLAPGSCPVVY